MVQSNPTSSAANLVVLLWPLQDVPQTQAHAPFVNHWAACQMCTESIPMMVEDGGADNEWSNHCRDTWMDNFAFANRTVSMLLGCEQASLVYALLCRCFSALQTLSWPP